MIKVDRLKKCFLLCLLSTFLLALASVPVLASVDGIEYRTHVENEGWQDYVQNGATSGTIGKNLQLEAINIRLINPQDVNVEYRTHVQDIGWQDYVADDNLSGSEGQNKQIEAISVRLCGADSPSYNVFYRVHAQDYGWLGWAANGEDAGTSGQGKHLEAVEIFVQPVTEPAPESEAPAFIEAVSSGENPDEQPQPEYDPNTPVHYRAYVAGAGWNPWCVNGQETGSGDERGIEAFQLGLSNANYQDGNIIYKKLGGTGWTDWLTNDDVAGAPGDPVQGVRIKLTGKLGFLKDIYYRVHCPNIGWTNWAKNGEACGSEGYGRGVSLIQVIITGRGEVPGPTGNAFTQTPWYWPLPGINSISTYFGPRGSSHHDGIDVPAPEGTPIHAVKSGIVRFADYNDGLNHSVLYGAFGNCVVVEHDSGEFVYYGHMSSMAVSAGSRVETGQVIGYVGTTGNSLGNHLHLEVYDSRDELVDPLGFY